MSENEPNRLSLMPVRLKQMVSDSYWRGIFDKYDSDKDGFISRTELAAIIEDRECKIDVPDNAAEEIMTLVDEDRSGKLDFKEFKGMMQHPDLTAVFGHFVTKYVDWVAPPPNAKSLRPPSGRTTSHPNAMYEDTYPMSCWPPPLLMALISVVQIALFFYDFVRYPDDKVYEGPAAKILMYCPFTRKQAWRFISYILIHGGFGHLLWNVLVQLFLGIPLESRQSSWRVGAIYVAGGAAGSVAASVAVPDGCLLGASAGVYALFTAHFVTLMMNWSKRNRPWIKLILLLLMAAIDLGCTWYYYNDFSTVSYVAHLGGALTGLLIGVGLLRHVTKWRKRLWAAVGVYFTLMIIGILCHIFWTKHFPPMS